MADDGVHDRSPLAGTDRLPDKDSKLLLDSRKIHKHKTRMDDAASIPNHADTKGEAARRP
jgi:hypothetical protein